MPAWATTTSAVATARSTSPPGTVALASIPRPSTSVEPVCHSTSASGGSTRIRASTRRRKPCSIVPSSTTALRISGRGSTDPAASNPSSTEPA